MYEIPGFDPKTMTDEQLLDRTHELNRKVVFAASFGVGGVEMMQNMLVMIENERMERLVVAQHNREMQFEPPVIESDPSMKTIDGRSPAARERGKVVRTRPTITRTSVPIATPHPVLPNRDQPTDQKPS